MTLNCRRLVLKATWLVSSMSLKKTKVHLLQVKYGVGIFNSLGEFTVRYRLMQDLYVEAVSGLDSAVDLLYQFEFE